MKRRWPLIFDDLTSNSKVRFPIIVATWIGVLLLGIWLGGTSKNTKNLIETATLRIPSLAPPSTETVAPPAPTPSPSPTLVPETSSSNLSPAETEQFSDGLLVLSLADGYYKHLFVYHPTDLQLTRLTNHPWDDIHPAISPDGSRLAYASRRSGFWDIYIFNLNDGSSIRVTDSLTYDGNPTWSPDGQWLAYESYQTGNLDIFLQSLADLSIPPLQLTDDLSPDFSPAWSPLGNEIAFSSLRSGEPEIWTAAVDQLENRFHNVSRSPDTYDSDPAWSPDGSQLSWTSNIDGSRKIALHSIQQAGAFPENIASGSAPLWSPDGGTIILQLAMPNSSEIAGLDTSTHQLTIPAIPMESEIFGMDWKSGGLGRLISAYLLTDSGARVSLQANDPASRATDPVTGRTGLVALASVNAPHALLSDSVDESFSALRTEVARLTGWDVLANLENAYLPYTDPANASLVDDWLVTGLGFAINPLPMQAGWMVVQKEDFSGEVYWRLYIRARYQDGSQGIPLAVLAWDLDSRSSGSPQAYEAGGAANFIPEGYWVDMTELANRFGWQRLPAVSNWRTYYPGARFNHFAHTRGLDWETAMLELYPQELVHQPTRVPTLTSIPTVTSLPLNSRTATAQYAGRLLAPTSPNPRPTFTPAPGENFP